MAGLEPAEPGSVVTLVTDEDGTPVIKLVGELDLSTVTQVDAAMAPILAGEPGRIVLELTDLEFMDSSGIALVLHLANRVPEVNLRNPSTIVRQVLQITGLTDTLRIVS